MKIRIYLTVLAGLFAVLHLSIEHFNGGIISHHLLNQADMPAISNWWGLLLLPLLTWFLYPRMRTPKADAVCIGLGRPQLIGLLGAIIYGAIMAGSFAYGYEGVTSAMFLGLFILAVFLPLYRAEFVLGFVLGMTFTFGAVLPTVFAGVIALLSYLLNTAARYLFNAARRLGNKEAR